MSRLKLMVPDGSGLRRLGYLCACRLDRELRQVMELAESVKRLDVRISTSSAYLAKVQNRVLNPH